MLPPDVEPVAEIQWEEEDEGVLYRTMVDEARSYLDQFPWCISVEGLYGGKAVPGVIATFLATIIPSSDAVDERLWVIVGDVPPAYLVVDHAPTSDLALVRYVEEMEAWVDAVQAGEPVDDLIPVNVEPTPEYARMLASRLAFLRSEVIAD